MKKFKVRCTRCRHYSFAKGRCVLGKMLPKTIKGGVDAARFFGLDYICSLDVDKKTKIRNKLLEVVK